MVTTDPVRIAARGAAHLVMSYSDWNLRDLEDSLIPFIRDVSDAKDARITKLERACKTAANAMRNGNTPSQKEARDICRSALAEPGGP